MIRRTVGALLVIAMIVVASPAFAAPVATIAFVKWGNEIWGADSTGAVTQALYDNPEGHPVEYLAWGGQGAATYYLSGPTGGQTELRRLIVGESDSVSLATLPASFGYPCALAVAPDDSAALVSLSYVVPAPYTATIRICRVDLLTGQYRVLFQEVDEDGNLYAPGIVWTQAGAFVLWSTSDGASVWKLDPNSGTLIDRLESTVGEAYYQPVPVDFTANIDGSRLAYLTYKGDFTGPDRIKVINPTTEQLIASISAATLDGHPSLSPNGASIACSLFDSSTVRIVRSSDGGLQGTIAAASQAEWRPRVLLHTTLYTPLAGANRTMTAVTVSKTGYPRGAETVVVATAYNWPDALGGAALAGAVDGPILLTGPSALPAEVSAEITRLGATHAIILGGRSAVGPAVETALKSKLGAANVQRLAGADRYETARLIAARTVAELGASYDGTAFVATGANFPDALGASPLAAFRGWPIFLVNPTVGADAALVGAMKASGVEDAIVLGSTKAIPDRVLSGLGTTTALRLAGTDRYDTACKIATYGALKAGASFAKVAIATGENFPDALAGGVLQGTDRSVMLLTPSRTLDSRVLATIRSNRSLTTATEEVRFLGGTSALSPSVRQALVDGL